MTFTVKDFIKMLALDNDIIEVEIEINNTCIYLVWEYCGKRRTFDENIYKYSDAVVLRTNTSMDDDGIVCFTLYIDPNDKNIKN